MPDLDSKQKLSLSREILVGIYNGTIKNWNHPLIKNVNKFPLPSKSIKVVVREDKSGSTEILTNALSLFDKNWKKKYGIFNKKEFWDKNIVYTFGRRVSGISDIVKITNYSIGKKYLFVLAVHLNIFLRFKLKGYTSLNSAKDIGLKYSRVINKAGKVTEATTKAVQFSMDSNANFSKELTAIIVDADGKDSYPISGYTYIIVSMTGLNDCDKAVELVRYFDWFFSTEQADAECVSFNMVPLSRKVKKIVQERVLKKMQCAGKNVWDLVLDQMQQEKKVNEDWKLVVGLIVPIFFLILTAVVIYFGYNKLKTAKLLNRNDWMINFEDIMFYIPDENQRSFNSKLLKADGISQTSETVDLSCNTGNLHCTIQFQIFTVNINLISFVKP